MQKGNFDKLRLLRYFSFIHMPKKDILKALQKYQKSRQNSTLRRNYLRSFTPKMIYRTTKTENPTTTKALVKKVLDTLS